MTAPDVESVLDQLAYDPLFKGVRLSSLDWQSQRGGLHALAQRNLACDVLPREGMLPHAVEMMRVHSHTRFIVNHLAGLTLSPGGVPTFAEQLKPLADLPNVLLKFSAIQGLAEPPPITVETLWPHLESTLTLFGAQRLLFASDWPVSTLSGSYSECIAVMRAATASLSTDEQEWIWGKTAISAYGLASSIQTEPSNDPGR
jgi:L-fuconolactonase